MGKAAIISEAGGGLYTIEVKHDTAVADAQLAKLESILAAIDAKIAEASGKPKPDQSVIGALKLRKTAIEKRIDRVKEAARADFQTQAWCADLTEELTGEVGTIEPGAEMKNGINIRPGFDDDATFVRTRDGQATPFLTMGVADAMRNFALMPAIQRWRPTYRYATISNIDTDADTCRVTLEPLFSSIQDLDINHQAAFDDVPVEYMSCNAAAFDNGDAVIVRFDPYDVSGQPKVIGFKSNPKPCEGGPYVIIEAEGAIDPDQPSIVIWDIPRGDYVQHKDFEGLDWPVSWNQAIGFLNDLENISAASIWNMSGPDGDDQDIYLTVGYTPHTCPDDNGYSGIENQGPSGFDVLNSYEWYIFKIVNCQTEDVPPCTDFMTKGGDTTREIVVPAVNEDLGDFEIESWYLISPAHGSDELRYQFEIDEYVYNWLMHGGDYDCYYDY